jgi:hypothetical protein
VRDKRLLEDSPGVENRIRLGEEGKRTGRYEGIPSSGESPEAMHETVDQVCRII